MGRGKHLSTKVKEEKKLIKARLDAEKKWKEKNWTYLLKQKLIDSIDPLKFAAMLVLVPSIKLVIDEIPQLIDWWKRIQMIASPVLTAILLYTNQLGQTEIKEEYKWALAMGLSYLIVEHFDALLESGRDVTSFIRMLLITG